MSGAPHDIAPPTVPAPAGVPLDLVAARRWAMAARAALGEHRARIDALNVFPVPDGDTGTNLFLTMDGALEMLRAHLDAGGPDLDLTDGLGVIARGTLLSARGNSGVILSQLARGLHEAVLAAQDRLGQGPDGRPCVGPRELADAFARADQVAWAGVAEPVEGTMLSVARAAAGGAAGATLHQRCTALDVADAALAAARAALDRTPEQLPVLASAGVVDAGGAGLVVVLEALRRVLSDQAGTDDDTSGWTLPAPTARWPTGAGGCAGPDAADGAVEVMYLLTGSDPGRAGHLRAHLHQVGESVQVVGGPAEWRVHVHLADPHVAVEAGAAAGHVEQVSVLGLLTGGARAPTAPTAGAAPQPRVGVVACVPGEGVAELVAEAGAEVVRSAPGSRASTGQLLNAVWAARADTVLILPNDPDSHWTARAAARVAAEDGLRVDVVPTRSVVQGLAALAVLDPDGDPGEVAAALREAAEATRYGAVSRAPADGVTQAGPCRAGQWLAVVGERAVAVTDDEAAAVTAVVEDLLRTEAELLTIVLGEVGDLDSTARSVLLGHLEQGLRTGHPGVELHVVSGGQPRYPWLLGAE